MTLIQGAGGGGKGGKTPTIEKDNLKNTQYAIVMDLLSEGEIEGLVDEDKSIYFNDVPIDNPDGTSNFAGYRRRFRTGTLNQEPILRSNNKTQVSKLVQGGEFTKANSPGDKTITITNPDVDRVRCILRIPSFLKQEDDGDVVGTSVRIKIFVKYNNENDYTEVIDDTIKGKSSSEYLKDYNIDLAASTGSNFPVSIKMSRLSADSTERNPRDTYFAGYSEIIDEKLRYPHSAYAWLRFDAKEFGGSVPKRKYLIKGIKVRIPSNGTVDTNNGRIEYDPSIWNGSFGAATWTSDPAWILWDLLTDTRYGCKIPEDQLSKWDFYEISKYCNELVDDGTGTNTKEPRFSLNVWINTRQEVFDLINSICSAFRGMAYYASGTITPFIDKPTDSQYLLGPSNVVDGAFTYSGTSQKTRHTTCTVSWQSYDLLGEVQWEYCEDADAVAKYGVVNKSIKGYGCYSQGQARRLGLWTLKTEQLLTDSVSFGVSIESGIILKPGMVISIADPTKNTKRRSGRVSSASPTAITVDNIANASVDFSNNPTLSVILPTGLVETKPINTIVNNTINIEGAFSSAPDPSSIWMIETTDIPVLKYRVLNIKDEANGTYAVSALTYNESIYDAVETGLEVVVPQITLLNKYPEAVSGITFDEHLYQDGANVMTALDISWQAPTAAINDETGNPVLFNETNIAGYVVNYRLNNDNWISVSTDSPSIQILKLKTGAIEVEILAQNASGVSGKAFQATHQLKGKTTPPSDVTGLSFEPITENSGRLTWDEAPDIDVRVGGKIKIRHSSKTDGSGTYTNSADLITALPGSETEATIPLLEGEIICRFVDSSNNLSANDTSVIIDLPETSNLLAQSWGSVREDETNPPFQGSATDVVYDSNQDALILASLGFDSITDFDNVSDLDAIDAGTASSGTYNFNDLLDLGGVFAVDLKRYFVARGFRPSDTIDSRTELIDTWDDFDGALITNVNAAMQVRKTTDDPGGSPTWGNWQNLSNGTFKGRAFQFKAILSTTDNSENILIDQLGYNASFKQRSEQSIATVDSSTLTSNTVNFSKPFFVGTSSLGGANTYLPSIGITAQNLSSGDYFEVSNVSASSFQVLFKNSSGSTIDKNFTWSAVGYGKGA